MDRRAFLGATTATIAFGCASGSRRTPAAAAARGPIRLDANENPYGPSPSARAALRATVDQGNRYTDAAETLAQAIAARHAVTPEHVVLGAGSFALLGVVAVSALRGGGNVVLATPTFDVVAKYADTLGAASIRVPLDRRSSCSSTSRCRAVPASSCSMPPTCAASCS